MFAKLENKKLIICPRNGYVDSMAISNLPEYFELHPEMAKQEGYMPVVYLDDPVENSVFTEDKGVIYEKPI